MTRQAENDEGGRGSLRGQLRPVPVPASLHDRVRGTLSARGLLDDRTHRLRRALLLSAAAALFFIAGLASAKLGSGPGSTRGPATARYVLLLYGGTETEDSSRAEEYGRWAAGLTEGKFLEGHELRRTVAEYGPASGGEPVAGYFVIDAASDAVAAKIALSCPHLKYGGRVIVRSIGS